MKTNYLFASTLSIFWLTASLVTAEYALPDRSTNDRIPNNPPKKATTYIIDNDQSVVTWNAKKVTGEHTGTVKTAKGTVTVDGSKLTAATVDIDMRTLVDNDHNGRLETHLKSDDFFSVEKNPTATFVLTKVAPKGGNEYDVTGNLTIKGITQSVSFPATVVANSNTLEAKGKMTINRTKYDIKYRSGTFFENIGDKMIYDDFTLDLKIVAKKASL
ncbi:MAG: YceI family protein [Cytophagaceae bacterium]|nr:YceI family protein [Cytophagaceae bacterium]